MKPMQLFWLECAAGDLPGHTDWLSPEEQSLCSRLRFQKRRNDWLLGRWTAKCALAAHLQLDAALFPHIAILPESSGAPVVTIGQSPAGISISISHRAGRGFVVVGAPNVPVGADLEFVESHGPIFAQDYFTPEEIGRLEQAHDPEPEAVIALIWSGKESALKLRQLGLNADTRCVSIRVSRASVPNTNWRHFNATFVDGKSYGGWWERSGDWVRTQVAASATLPPIELLAPQTLLGTRIAQI